MIRLLYGISETPHRCFNSRDFATILQKTVRRGLYLFSGPVGSGKTSLMYRLALKEKRQVITIEDPVEIEEPFFLQLQINPKIAQTYDTLLKLALRHRPDLLIIGEIRDESTAHAAVRAALTGHRVFATVHARNLEGTLIRIHELTKKKEELSECLAGVIYQELLEDADHHHSVLWSYQFMEEEPVKKSWEESYEEAQKKTWQSELF